MWHWLLKRLGNSPPENGSVPAWTPADADDDYLAEEIILRAIAAARGGDPEKDFNERFAAAAVNLELPPQVRIFRLQLPAGFMIAHPLLGVKLMAMRYALRNPPKIDTTDTQIAIAKRCRELLNDIELGREMSAQAGRVARKLASQCNWNVNQLRNAVVMGVVVPSDNSQQKIEVKKPSKIHSATAMSIGTFFVVFAAFFAMYGIGHSISCGMLDCALIGSAQLAIIGFTLGIPPLQHCRTRSNLYKVARSCIA